MNQQIIIMFNEITQKVIIMNFTTQQKTAIAINKLIPRKKLILLTMNTKRIMKIKTIIFLKVLKENYVLIHSIQIKEKR